MIVKRFYDEKLAQASYLVGCSATGEALVVDANRDVGAYLEAAAAEELRVAHVTETHIHADFVSGSRELAARAGARLYLSAEGGDEWSYAFAGDAGAILLRDGDVIDVGNVRVQAVHTPGHTPEHLSFLVTDRAAGERPMAALTGDFIFVGDVGRPDLLEKAAGVRGTMDSAARDLFHSVQRFRAEQPDWLQIWPGHGAGSACGKGIGQVPQSTMGYEALTNWAFSHDDEDDFVSAVLRGQPEPPRYFAEMKRINRDGPRILGGVGEPRRVEAARLPEALADGAVVIDTRAADEFAAGHVPGTLNIPLNRSFTTWAGWLVPYERDFYLLGTRSAVAEAARDLAMIGLDRLAGAFPAEAVAEWAGAGGTPGRVPVVDVEDAAARLGRGDHALLDVRGAAEWESVRIPGAVHIPLGELTERLAELPRDRTLLVHCESGSRSAIAASVLRAHGAERVVDFRGGIRAWQAEGRPVESGAEAASTAHAAAVSTDDAEAA